MPSATSSAITQLRSAARTFAIGIALAWAAVGTVWAFYLPLPRARPVTPPPAAAPPLRPAAPTLHPPAPPKSIAPAARLRPPFAKAGEKIGPAPHPSGGTPPAAPFGAAAPRPAANLPPSPHAMPMGKAARALPLAPAVEPNAPRTDKRRPR